LKRTTNEERLMGPRASDGWIKIGVGVLLIKHETFQSLINLFSLKMLASWGGGGGVGGGGGGGGGGVKKIPRVPFLVTFKLLN
jgi:hypothetical protein